MAQGASRTAAPGRTSRLVVWPDPPLDESGLDEYLRELKKHAPISREEEVRLARRARAGDTRAIRELVQANLRFVVTVAKQYEGRGLPLSDLIQQGNLGLMNAAEKFDPERGVKFISYAVWWIRQAIHAALAHHSRAVRVPLNRAAEIRKVLRTRARMKEELGRDATQAEVAERLEIDTTRVALLDSFLAAEVRLDAPVGEDERTTVLERLIVEDASSPAAETERHLLLEEIEEALGTLRERDALILTLYYGLRGERAHTLEEIGQRLGVSRERVRQLRDRALQELREGARGEALASFAI